MKISFVSVYNFFIYIIVILNLGFLNFFFQSDRIVFKISIVLSLIVFLIYIFQPHKKNITKNTALYVALTLGLYLIEFLRKSRPYVISTDNMIYQFGGIALLLLSFPMYEVISSDKKNLLAKLVIIGYVILTMKFIVWFFYNFFQINLAPGVWGYKIDWTRQLMGRTFTRLSGTFIDELLLVYSFFILITKENKVYKRILSGIGILFLLFYAIVVTQYRMIIVLYILTILGLTFLVSYKSNNRTASLVILVLFLSVILIVNWTSIKDFIATFSTNSNITGGSTSFRLWEFKYFKSLWVHNNFWLGFGFIPDMVIPYNGVGYYLSDLGFTANLYQFGLIGFFILILPFFVGVISSVRCLWLSAYKNKLNFIFIGLTLYIVMSLIPYNPYNPSLITFMPIYISLLNYCNISNLNE